MRLRSPLPSPANSRPPVIFPLSTRRRTDTTSTRAARAAESWAGGRCCLAWRGRESEPGPRHAMPRRAARLLPPSLAWPGFQGRTGLLLTRRRERERARARQSERGRAASSETSQREERERERASRDADRLTQSVHRQLFGHRPIIADPLGTSTSSTSPS